MFLKYLPFIIPMFVWLTSLKGDKVDSLKISYTSIADISATRSGGGFSILAFLKSPPRIGSHPVETSGSELIAKWSIHLSDIDSFRSSLKVRGLVSSSFAITESELRTKVESLARTTRRQEALCYTRGHKPGCNQAIT
jgi:hypothetical protein